MGKLWGERRNHLQKLQNRAIRILTNSSYDADARPRPKDLELKKIQDLIDSETKIMVFKARNGLAPEHLSDLLIRNYNSHLRLLRNTSTDLQLPKKTTNNGQRCFHVEVQNRGMPFFVKYSRYLP